MSDETPDTTGLRQVPDLLAALQRSVDAAKAARAAHPTPDASPDPAVVTPDAGHVEGRVFETIPADTTTVAPHCVTCARPMGSEPLTSAVGDALRAAGYLMPGDDVSVIADHLASHVAAAREANRAEVERLHALADTHREVAESMSAKWQEELDRADRLEAMCDRLAGDRVDREDAAEARAEAAEERLAGLVAKIEALADEWGIDLHAGSTITSGDDFAEAIGDNGAWRFARDLRALLPADAATALDAVREKAKAKERERIAQSIEAMGNVCISAHGDRCVGGIAYRDAARIARHTPEDGA